MKIILNLDLQKHYTEEYKEFNKNFVIDMEEHKVIERLKTIDSSLMNKEIIVFKVKTDLNLWINVDSHNSTEELIKKGSILVVHSTKNKDKSRLESILHNIYFKIYKYFMFNKYLTVKDLSSIKVS